MVRDEAEDRRTYTVVRNHEEQYSLWPLGRALPLGWEAVGMEGSKADCLAYIETHWTDMRPLSLRTQNASAPMTTAPSVDTDRG